MGTCGSEEVKPRPRRQKTKSNDTKYTNYFVAKKAIKYYKEQIAPSLEQTLVQQLDHTFVSKEEELKAIRARFEEGALFQSWAQESQAENNNRQKSKSTQNTASAITKVEDLSKAYKDDFEEAKKDIIKDAKEKLKEVQKKFKNRIPHYPELNKMSNKQWNDLSKKILSKKKALYQKEKSKLDKQGKTAIGKINYMPILHELLPEAAIEELQRLGATTARKEVTKGGQGQGQGEGEGEGQVMTEPDPVKQAEEQARKEAESLINQLNMTFSDVNEVVNHQQHGIALKLQLSMDKSVEYSKSEPTYSRVHFMDKSYFCFQPYLRESRKL